MTALRVLSLRGALGKPRSMPVSVSAPETNSPSVPDASPFAPVPPGPAMPPRADTWTPDASSPDTKASESSTVSFAVRSRAPGGSSSSCRVGPKVVVSSRRAGLWMMRARARIPGPWRAPGRRPRPRPRIRRTTPRPPCRTTHRGPRDAAPHLRVRLPSVAPRLMIVAEQRPWAISGQIRQIFAQLCRSHADCISG